jgi:hypothetical protein
MSRCDVCRAVSENLDVTDKLFKIHSTMRPPGHVPYVVDNLWEWKRPDEFPNRRFSAFACPTPELAGKTFEGNCKVYRVEFNGEIKKTKMCQLRSDKVPNLTDSKFHPECISLRKLLISKLGMDWFSKDMSKKQAIASLWMPCLRKEDAEKLFESAEELRTIRDDIYDAIQYWSDVVLIENMGSIPNPEGELFFEYPDGYYLRPI